MFDHKHYVPILRWKQAEWLALRHLDPAHCAQITPLVEVTPRSVAPRTRRPTVEQMLQKNAADMRENWHRAPLFVDLWHLEGLPECGGVHPFLYLSREARAQNVSLIPVTGLSRPHSYQSAVASIVGIDLRGACVRLFIQDVTRPNLGEHLDELLSRLDLERGQVDLLVDCQYIDGSCPDWSPLVARIPHLRDWRTFVLASGAFPPDLTGFRVGQHLLARMDWQAWRRLLAAGAGLERKPAYGDYTIQHALYREAPARANFSASIRYTAHSHWVIMRGEGVFHDVSPGFPQWPANAQLLCSRPEFCGDDFSYGDTYIYQMSQQTDQTGSAETWLRAGINHHLTFVVSQIANPFGT